MLQHEHINLIILKQEDLIVWNLKALNILVFC